MSPEPSTIGTSAGLAARLANLVFGPVLRTRREVEAHDREAERIYEDLMTWVRDDDRDLRADFRRIENDLAARGILSSGEFTYQRAEAKRLRLHRYRDQRRQAKRRIEDMRAAEGMLHRLWRKRLQRPLPESPVQEQIANILKLWREPEGGGDYPVLEIDEP